MDKKKWDFSKGVFWI